MDDDDPLCSVRFLRITNILLAGRVMSNLVAEMQLWQATSVGDHALVKILMRENPNVSLNWSGPDRQDAPLHRACRYGHLEAAEELLCHRELT